MRSRGGPQRSARCSPSPWPSSHCTVERPASLPGEPSLLAYVASLRRRRPELLLIAGLLTGAAFMVKQSALDAGLAAVAYLVWTTGRRAVRPVALFLTAAVIP